jgi:outer membrane receptor protein involved in Fe transport
MYSDRTSDTDSIRTTLGLRPSENIIGNEGKDIFLNMGADASLPNELHLQLLSTYSESNQDTDTQVLRTLPALSSFSTSNQESKNVDITAKLSGNIVELPSGSIRFSFGGGYAKDQYVFDSLLQSSASTSTVGGDLSRHSTYAFAETFIPLVSPQQGITAVNRLELTLAGRYTDYSDFGSATSPKLGLLWSPIHSLKLRGSYAKSFRAPFLTELDPSLTSWALLPLSTYPALARQYGLAPTANLLLAYGNNTALGPERAKSKTFGFDIAPESIPRFKLSATYFDIDYTDRIGRPDSGFLALRNPALFSSLFTLSPGVDQIAELISGARNFSNSPRVDLNDPAAVAASTALLYDDRNLNLAISELSGLDLGLSYKVAGLSFGTELSRLFHYNKQARPTDSLVAVVDQVGQPVSLRARSWVGFDRSSMSAQLGVNYVDSYSNASDPANPDVASWTTLDLSAAYASEAGYGLTQGLRFSLSIRNLLNRDPPSVPLSTVTNAGVLEQIGYDPSNADPIGRFISLEVIKRWGGGTH